MTIRVEVLPPALMLIGHSIGGGCGVKNSCLWPLQIALSSAAKVQLKSAAILTSFYIQFSTIKLFSKYCLSKRSMLLCHTLYIIILKTMYWHSQIALNVTVCFLAYWLIDSNNFIVVLMHLCRNLPKTFHLI